jgi:hypothetical protein
MRSPLRNAIRASNNNKIYCMYDNYVHTQLSFKSDRATKMLSYDGKMDFMCVNRSFADCLPYFKKLENIRVQDVAEDGDHFFVPPFAYT